MISGNRSSGSKFHHKEPAADDADNADGRGFEARGHLRYPRRPRLVSLVYRFLIPGNLEFPLLITNSPGAGDELIVCADILELAVNDVVHHLAGRIFYVGFEVEHPR